MTVAELKFLETVPMRVKELSESAGSVERSTADIANELHTLNTHLEKIISLIEGTLEN